MNIPSLLVLILMIGAMAYIGWVIFIGIPSDLTSMFRYKMWRIRDDAVDKIIAGEQIDADGLRAVATTSEILILCADELTAAQCVAFLGASAICVQQNEAKEPPFLTDGDTAAITVAEPAASSFAALFFRRILTSSPLGWLLFCVIAVPWAFLWIVSRMAGRAGLMFTNVYQRWTRVSGLLFGSFLASAPPAKHIDAVPMG
jgi:hypothetical protein